MAKAWSRLDNAAKIFPANTTRRDSKVFRYTCALHDKVDRGHLQRALEQTISAFPFFRSVLKRGLFWNYLEISSLPIVVTEEKRPPCAPLYERSVRRLLFRVCYYGKRIHLEAHHSLTDGTGALHFFQMLICHYLRLCHPEQLADLQSPPYDASAAQRGEDSFQKFYNPSAHYTAKKRRDPRAHRVRGALLSENRMHVIEGCIPVGQVLAAAKRQNTTLTAYLTAQLMLAFHNDMSLRQRRDRPVVITVPVNLRKFYDSETARNFFATMQIGCDFSQGETLGDVARTVAEAFRTELTAENMDARMSHMIGIEQNIAARFVPLFIKDPMLWAAGQWARRGITAALSNVGKIDMPEQVAPYIDRFSLFAATPDFQVCLCTYNDQLVIGLTSVFASLEIPRRFFRQLASDGMDVGILSNYIPGGDDT